MVRCSRRYSRAFLPLISASSAVKPYRFFSVVLFLLFGSLLSPLSVNSANSAPLAAGFLISAQGEVLLDGKKVQGGVPVQEGAQIQTGPNGKCTLMVGRDIILHLASQTSLKVVTAEVLKRKAEFQLGHGKIRALVRSSQNSPRSREFPDVEVRSRAVTLGVRGTQFTVDSPFDRLVPQRFVAIEGEVSLNLPQGSQQSDSLDSNPMEVGLLQKGPITLARGQAFVLANPSSTDRTDAEGPVQGGRVEGRVVTLSQQEVEKESLAVVAPPRPMLTTAQFQNLGRAGEQSGGSNLLSQDEERGAAEGENTLGRGGAMRPAGDFALQGLNGAVIPLDPIVDGGGRPGAGRNLGVVEISLIPRKQP